MNSIAGAVAVVAFWTFVAVSAVTSIRYDYRKRQLAIDALKCAIEHGQTMDAQVLEKLLSPEKARTEDYPRQLTVAGIITASVGIGLMPLSLLVGQIEPKAFYPILGSGIVVFCTSVGLLIAARYLRHTAAPHGGAPAGSTDRPL